MARKPLLSLLLLSATTLWIAARPTDILTDLRLTTDDLHETSVSAVTSDEFTLPDLTSNARQWAKRLSASGRTDAVRALGRVVRSYTETADFRTRYDEWLQNQYNVSESQTQEASLASNTSHDDLKNNYNQTLTHTNQVFASMDPAMLSMALQSQMQVTAQAMNEAVGTAKTGKAAELTKLRQLQALSRTNPAEFKKQYIAHLTQNIGREANRNLAENQQTLATEKQKAADYQKRFAQYNANANPDIALRKKLRQFIALTESVDFDARVTQQGYRIEFVSPTHRAQSDNWKLLYRMGREPVMAARTFAQTWLQDLERTARR